MKGKIEEIVELPEGISCLIEINKLTIKGPKGENIRVFQDPKVNIETKENKIFLVANPGTKKEKTKIGSFKAHVKNMIKGVNEPFIYKLKICSGHFPMNVSISGEKFIVKNFLGEKVPRQINIKKGAKVTIDAQEVTVESLSKEVAGQVAADIEQLCRITNRDRRIFQDGIYIINKAGKEI
jgi:large subunit ribosomal protein L6